MARQGVCQCGLEEVLFLLPAVFPHKSYSGASFEQRLGMLSAALAGEARYSIGSSEEGLFVDIARACRPEYPPEAKFFFLCGRDAAERIIGWNYAGGTRFEDLLEEFQMLVAPREGRWVIPAGLEARIQLLSLAPGWEACSSSVVREAVAAGASWEALVPEAVAAMIRRERLYVNDPVAANTLTTERRQE